MWISYSSLHSIAGRISVLILTSFVLLISGSCEKQESKLELGISAFVVQSDFAGEPVFDLYIGFTTNEEMAEEGAFVTRDGVLVEGESHIPNMYEIRSNPVKLITNLNGTYVLNALSKNGKSVSHTIPVNLTEYIIPDFSVTDFKFSQGEGSATFKDIDISAEVYGYYINPLFEEVSALSRAYAKQYTEQRSSLVKPETTVSFSYKSPVDCISTKIYPLVAKKNGAILQVMFGEPLIVPNN